MRTIGALCLLLVLGCRDSKPDDTTTEPDETGVDTEDPVPSDTGDTGEPDTGDTTPSNCDLTVDPWPITDGEAMLALLPELPGPAP